MNYFTNNIMTSEGKEKEDESVHFYLEKNIFPNARVYQVFIP